VISLVGNLLLMRLFVGWLDFPVLAANVLTIAVCALANFAVSDRWVFAEDASQFSSYGTFTCLLSLSRASEPRSAARRGRR